MNFVGILLFSTRRGRKQDVIELDRHGKTRKENRIFTGYCTRSVKEVLAVAALLSLLSVVFKHVGNT